VGSTDAEWDLDGGEELSQESELVTGAERPQGSEAENGQTSWREGPRQLANVEGAPCANKCARWHWGHKSASYWIPASRSCQTAGVNGMLPEKRDQGALRLSTNFSDSGQIEDQFIMNEGGSDLALLSPYRWLKHLRYSLSPRSPLPPIKDGTLGGPL
jgi:hypothetical protein